MQWWNNFLDWFNSDAGEQVMTTAIIPAFAILVAGIIAALIGRAATKRIVELHEREKRAAAITALIASARRAARWNSLSAPEQQHAEHVALEADVQVRLLPVTGAAMAADWAIHEIAEMKKNAVSFSFQAEQSLIEFRSRMLEWQDKPSRAKKLFKNDLDSWAYEASLTDQELIAQQQAWAAQQAAGEATSKPVVEDNPPSVFTTPATPVKQDSEGVTRPIEPQRAPLRPQTGAFAMPAAPGASAGGSPANDSAGIADDTLGSEQTPMPKSASTVRQRIAPDDGEHYG